MAARAPARPVIGINADLLQAGKTAPSQARLNLGYADCVFNAGGLPLIIPPLHKDAEVDEYLNKVDGFVLSGGLDLDPRRQNLPTHPTVVPMAPRREESDAKLLKRIVERKIPLLAIGVGMQQLNAFFGGNLFLHLPAENAKAMPHFDNGGGAHRHIVLVEPKTLLDDIYGTTELRVNSSHHQGIKTLGTKLRVSAKCPDEVIEAIESTDPHWFCIGVQWHPEAETASALDQQLFECFIQATTRAGKPLQLVA
ncbi:MAG: gamma-glutamyl-gamma-aminobutyrate hydrolase family protein [Gemmataceae bacterium]